MDHQIYFCVRRANTWNVSFETLQRPIYFINSVDNTKLPHYTLPPMQHHNFFRKLTPFIAFEFKSGIWFYAKINGVSRLEILLWSPICCSLHISNCTDKENLSNNWSSFSCMVYMINSYILITWMCDSILIF